MISKTCLSAVSPPSFFRELAMSTVEKKTTGVAASLKIRNASSSGLPIPPAIVDKTPTNNAVNSPTKNSVAASGTPLIRLTFEFTTASRHPNKMIGENACPLPKMRFDKIFKFRTTINANPQNKNLMNL